MTNQPPDPGTGDPTPPAQVPGLPTPPPGSAPPPGPPGYPPPPPPPSPLPPQPTWQGHQAPQQDWGGYAAPAPKKSRRLLVGVLSVLVIALIAGAVVLAIWLVGRDDDASGLAVSDLEAGQCLTGDDLEGLSSEAFGDRDITGLTEVDCDESHDLEVFAIVELDEDGDDGLAAAGDTCVDEAEDAGRRQLDLADDDLEIRPLAGPEPEEGDAVACFVRHQGGDRTTGSAFETDEEDDQ